MSDNELFLALGPERRGIGSSGKQLLYKSFLAQRTSSYGKKITSVFHKTDGPTPHRNCAEQNSKLAIIKRSGISIVHDKQISLTARHQSKNH